MSFFVLFFTAYINSSAIFMISVDPANGLWSYKITSSIAPGIPVQINVVATDRPGGTAEQNLPFTIPNS